jgi:hypothetical protein
MKAYKAQLSSKCRAVFDAGANPEKTPVKAITKASVTNKTDPTKSASKIERNTSNRPRRQRVAAEPVRPRPHNRPLRPRCIGLRQSRLPSRVHSLRQKQSPD